MPAHTKLVNSEDASETEAEGEERPRRRTGRDRKEPKEEVIPGAHLEPDLVLEEERRRERLEDAAPA